MKTARVTGTYPVSVAAVEKSPFVRNLTPEEQERYDQRQARNANRICISGSLITDPEFIVSLATQLAQIPSNRRYCTLTSYINSTYSSIVSTITKHPNNGRLLSPVPPLIKPNGSPVFFDTTIVE